MLPTRSGGDRAWPMPPGAICDHVDNRADPGDRRGLPTGDPSLTGADAAVALFARGKLFACSVTDLWRAACHAATMSKGDYFEAHR
jgi:hypothetical protein